ncbi:divalent-cation tolerance protein CutA [Mangrovactinospora gilvigrisea]|uniref:Divalent-cation tolerance protein CutA n=1 Tax=Mangrovactinospora gilvigrisea TaxID=1428644 RepID=A0A1J7BDC1_9ACTN|nr:divalent-cation tolerance protein CutA [Mangrovactinospora gilvigrisea]OIV36679.1 divalent-cation tolerance protein CutA [Mangrovactinospora gilvigrisea]
MVSDDTRGPALYVVLTTVASEQDAARLAEAAVRRRAAACAQIDGPVRSVYRWEGELQQEAEWRVMFKTAVEAWPRLRDFLAEGHPYETPEVVAMPVVAGSEHYVRWVEAETVLRSA